MSIFRLAQVHWAKFSLDFIQITLTTFKKMQFSIYLFFFLSIPLWIRIIFSSFRIHHVLMTMCQRSINLVKMSFITTTKIREREKKKWQALDKISHFSCAFQCSNFHNENGYWMEWKKQTPISNSVEERSIVNVRIKNLSTCTSTYFFVCLLLLQFFFSSILHAYILPLTIIIMY